MTNRVCLTDPYLAKFEARVTQKRSVQGRWEVLTDSTIFYPEGGGQPSDKGLLANCPVEDLKVDSSGDIVHILSKDPGVAEGDPVTMEIDLSRRFDFMQQHTGQHLLSQVILREANAETLSFSMGEEHSSIEIDLAGVEQQRISLWEDECAKLILAALPVKVSLHEDISLIPLRKPPKVSGTVRVVEIEGYDLSACGGTHVRNTRELMVVKILKTDRVRSRIRLYFTVGLRALRDYRWKNSLLNDLQRLMGTPQEELLREAEKQKAEREMMGKELKQLHKEGLERLLSSLLEGGEPYLERELPGWESGELRLFATSLSKEGRNVVAYSRDKGHIVVARGKGNKDLRTLSSLVFPPLQGRGGGREDLLEGKVGSWEGLTQVLGLLRETLGRGS